ncbi:hypothetical protein Nepgr_029004 [Nepenthes gracilis]|uniref:Uncharacterized protein n=1 Tax=Nepenthes gracilis TaxID=150966 RepID=A0AAD3TDE6_NEPGR|nr:hypothetical protein Nepgr_029004 [Nepenthes gracilis]
MTSSTISRIFINLRIGSEITTGFDLPLASAIRLESSQVSNLKCQLPPQANNPQKVLSTHKLKRSPTPFINPNPFAYQSCILNPSSVSLNLELEH